MRCRQCYRTYSISEEFTVLPPTKVSLKLEFMIGHCSFENGKTGGGGFG